MSAFPIPFRGLEWMNCVPVRQRRIKLFDIYRKNFPYKRFVCVFAKAEISRPAKAGLGLKVTLSRQ
jgi:hypothetical protein